MCLGPDGVAGLMRDAQANHAALSRPRPGFEKPKGFESPGQGVGPVAQLGRASEWRQAPRMITGGGRSDDAGTLQAQKAQACMMTLLPN